MSIESGRLAGVREPDAVECGLEESLGYSNMRMVTVWRKGRSAAKRAYIVADRMPEGFLPSYFVTLQWVLLFPTSLYPPRLSSGSPPPRFPHSLGFNILAVFQPSRYVSHRPPLRVLHYQKEVNLSPLGGCHSFTLSDKKKLLFTFLYGDIHVSVCYYQSENKEHKLF